MRKSIILILCAGILLACLLNQYLFCPEYYYSDSHSFKGDSLYNPYRAFNEENWKKCNFHAHTSSWKGFTNGNGSPADLWHRYASMGFAFNAVSNYQHIDTTFCHYHNYISAYEHGFNITKTHQLVLGDNGIVWMDYIFPQTRSNKQHILNLLAADTANVIILNHPSLRNGYLPDEMKFLENYDAMEVLNPAAESFRYWDIALSSGKPISIIGSDDMHNISDSLSSGRFCTLTYLPTMNRNQLLSSIRENKTIAMWIPFIPGMSFTERADMIRQSSPGIKSIEVLRDSLFIEFDTSVANFLLKGNNGKTLLSYGHIQKLAFQVPGDDPFVRASYMTADGIQYFLNPIYRYNGYTPVRSVRAAQHIFIHHRFNYLLLVILIIAVMVTTSFIYLRKFFSSDRSSDYLLY